MTSDSVYKKIMYLTIAFFFIVNSAILFFSKSIPSEFLYSLKKYNQVQNKKNIIKSEIIKNSHNKDFISAFTKSQKLQSSNFTRDNNVKININASNFLNSDDTYGFLELEIDDFKFFYDFKRVSLTPFKNEYSLYTSNQIDDTEILNKGGTLTLSAEDKIRLPSTSPLIFNLNFEQTEILKYLTGNERNDLNFYTGFDYHGFFSILLNQISPSRFIINDFTPENLNNFHANLHSRILEWKETDVPEPVDIKQKEFINNYEGNSNNFLDFSYFLQRAVLVSDRKVKIPSYITFLETNGIMLFRNVEIEPSSADLRNYGKLTICALEQMNISRNIKNEEGNNLINFIFLGEQATNFKIKTQNISASIFSRHFPYITSNLKLNGNLTTQYLSKENIRGSLNIKNNIKEGEHYVLSFSPVISYFSGDL
ncbi:MAG: hypothetical protein ACQESP_08935 [Candidatus Muiribacteriota bacterium]